MKLVIIESPLMNGIAIALRYARLAMKDAFGRGEAPWASHLLYPQCLVDAKPEERRLGIDAGLLWGQRAGLTAMYYDLGVTAGMVEGFKAAKACHREIEWRSLGSAWDEFRNAKETLWLLHPPSK